LDDASRDPQKMVLRPQRPAYLGGPLARGERMVGVTFVTSNGWLRAVISTNVVTR